VWLPLGLWPVQIVTLRLPEDANRLTLAVQLPVGQRVLWSYRQSVEQTRVESVFEVHSEAEKPCLILVQTRYGSTGTGLPTEENSRTRREGGMLVVDEPGELQGLTFRIQNNVCRFLKQLMQPPDQAILDGSMILIKLRKISEIGPLF
jgi:hypothetical protein